MDVYELTMPSGGRLNMTVSTPLTDKDREWLHKLIDLIVGEKSSEQAPSDNGLLSIGG